MAKGWSVSESDAKRAINRARDASRIPFRAGSAKLENEFVALDLLTYEEREAAVKLALQEILPANCSGPDPPGHTCVEPAAKGIRMYSFVWRSSQFGRELYFKFATVSESKGIRLVVLSFHDPDE